MSEQWAKLMQWNKQIYYIYFILLFYLYFYQTTWYAEKALFRKTTLFEMFYQLQTNTKMTSLFKLFYAAINKSVIHLLLSTSTAKTCTCWNISGTRWLGLVVFFLSRSSTIWAGTPNTPWSDKKTNSKLTFIPQFHKYEHKDNVYFKFWNFIVK